MHKFVRNLLTEWRKLKLPLAGETFVVAVSGGADSVALALALDDLEKRKKLGLRFVVAHFDHDLRGTESEADAEFVEKLSRNSGFELVFKKGKVSKRGNLEQNARRARYEFLTETARNLDAYGILTAHTVNDQAETFLLNLLRGSGPTGLAAMRPVISDYGFQISDRDKKSQIRLVRPLVGWAKRRDTEDFCDFYKIEYRTDSMNAELDFKRVRIRKILLPQMKEFNPKIVETLAKTANLIRLETETTSAGRILIGDQPFLFVRDLINLPKSELYNVLREWLKTQRGDLRKLDFGHIEALERLVLSRKSGRIAELPGGERVEKQAGKLFFRRKNIENIG